MILSLLRLESEGLWLYHFLLTPRRGPQTVATAWRRLGELSVHTFAYRRNLPTAMELVTPSSRIHDPSSVPETLEPVLEGSDEEVDHPEAQAQALSNYQLVRDRREPKGIERGVAPVILSLLRLGSEELRLYHFLPTPGCGLQTVAAARLRLGELSARTFSRHRNLLTVVVIIRSNTNIKLFNQKLSVGRSANYEPPNWDYDQLLQLESLNNQYAVINFLSMLCFK
ncbi:hypothetical protein M9H77_27198 [Catharanthus roseus]|uniref:Uncharacterized protein n=1 Tax=Catharanthus roseus TaxID=4058 RepID=A0ACC0AC03_CATRO|nr:hypothetical protein M9H77_27198 [Catharanthus roseus]